MKINSENKNNISFKATLASPKITSDSVMESLKRASKPFSDKTVLHKDFSFTPTGINHQTGDVFSLAITHDSVDFTPEHVVPSSAINIHSKNFAEQLVDVFNKAMEGRKKKKSNPVLDLLQK